MTIEALLPIDVEELVLQARYKVALLYPETFAKLTLKKHK